MGIDGRVAPLAEDAADEQWGLYGRTGVDAAEQKGSREEAHGDPGHQEHEQDTDDAA